MPQSCANNLLESLRSADFELIEPRLGTLQLDAGTTLYQPGDHVQTVYFPTGAAMAAYFVELPEGKGVETALIGREGAVGGIVSQGRLPSYSRCTVQSAGTFFTVSAEALEELKRQSASIRHLFARYADCLMAQVFQTTACNAAHTIDQRAAKWIVASYERTGETTLRLTQEHLAEMLGIGRSYISRVIARLKQEGIIQTYRKRLVVLDMDRIHDLACDCNEQVKRHFNEVLKGVYPES